MSTLVFLAVIGAAVLHASWNAAVKSGGDKHLAMGAVVLGHVPFGIAALFLVPAPDMASLPFLLAGIALHFVYQLFLLNSYRLGELTQVYPIARGSAPMIVAAVSVLGLGVMLSPGQLAAIAVIGAGILSLALVRRSDGRRNPQAALMALGTGCFIASYSLVDGLGARIAGTSLGFYGWLTIGNGIVMLIFLRLRAPGVVKGIAGPGRRVFWIGGGASFAAYALVTWAFTQAPIALVSAVRETSIIFAVLIGVVFMGERLSGGKIFATLVTVAGVLMLRLVPL